MKCQVLAIMRREKKGPFNNNFTETLNNLDNFFFRRARLATFFMLF
jgi:hypothetical protein